MKRIKMDPDDITFKTISELFVGHRCWMYTPCWTSITWMEVFGSKALRSPTSPTSGTTSPCKCLWSLIHTTIQVGIETSLTIYEALAWVLFFRVGDDSLQPRPFWKSQNSSHKYMSSSRPAIGFHATCIMHYICGLEYNLCFVFSISHVTGTDNTQNHHKSIIKYSVIH